MEAAMGSDTTPSMGDRARPRSARSHAITWSRFFGAYEPMHAVVAEDSGNLLGLAHFLFHRSTTQIAPTCYLQDLFTLEEARGKGVGPAPCAHRCGI